MRARVRFASVLALLAGGILVQPAKAQVLYGSIVGSVEDRTGGLVPGASVAIANKATGQSRNTATGGAGAYSFTDVLPGTYSVEVNATGFKTFTKTNVEVTINSVSRVDVQLELGTVAERVTVNAETTPLQTEKADVHVGLGTEEITRLPIPGYRNYQTLTNLVPGATPVNYQNAVIASPGRALTTNINGTTRNNNNTRLDGASNMRSSLPHQTLYVPPVETIEAVSISTNAFDAEQGLAGGAAITVTTRSGTNEFHGVIFEHHTNSSLTARNFFFLQPRKPKNISNIFGGTLGGPIRKNRLFFFAGWEGMRERSNFSRLASVPTLAQRAGEFTGLGVTIFDPLTGNRDGSGRTAFANAIIPADRQSAIARKMQDLIPLPNLPGLTSNYFTSAPVVFNRNNYDLKINWNGSAKTTLWGKYSAMKADVISQFSLGQAGGTGMVNGGGAGNGDVLAQVSTIGFSHIISPTFLIDGNFGFSRDSVSVMAPDFGRNFGLDVLGIPGTNGPDIRQSGMPMFVVTGYEVFGNGHDWQPKLLNDNNWTYTTSAARTKSAHDVRFGLDLIRYQLNHWHPEIGGNGPRGRFIFDGGVTALRGGGAPPNQFNAWAAFLLGLPQRMGKAVQFFDPSSPREWLEGYYFRDRWQARRKLTLTLGLRWEYYPLMSRAHSGIERYDPDRNTVLVGGFGSVSRDAGTTVSKKLFAPRVGLAYRVGQRSVLRTGYGISVDPYPLSASLLFSYPAVVNQDFQGPNSFQPFASLASGIPPVTGPDLSTGIIDMPLTATTVTLEKGPYTRGYIQSFNFILERELPLGLVGSVGYVGTRTIHQLTNLNINAAPPGGGPAGRPLAKRFGRSVDTNVLKNFTTTNYDSLQARLDRRFANGVMTKLSYTWSKAIDWTDDSSGGLLFNHLPAIARNRALSGFDRTHIFRLGWIAALPFGGGRRWANSTPAARIVLGGWQVNGILSTYSGTPFTVFSSGVSLNAPGNSQTADQVKPLVQKLGGIGPNVPYFDPLAFASVTETRFGTAGRNILRGPGVFNVDFGLFRNFSLSERWGVQFRAEAYNLTNTPNFNNPGSNVSNMRLDSDGTIRSLGGFMAITSAASRANNVEAGERQFRFALRISF